jgi:hypothetical protein
VAKYNPAVLLAIINAFRDFGTFSESVWEDLDADWGHGRIRLPMVDVVRVSAACIDESGWVSVSSAGEGRTSTKSNVSDLFFPPKFPSWADQQEAEWRAWAGKVRARYTPALEEEVAAAIVWAKGHLNSLTDYLYNLGAVACSEYIGVDKLGIAVSLIAAYRREQDRLKVREREQAAGANSQYVGTIGKREVFELTLLDKPVARENEFGTSYRCEFKDQTGNLFVWWASDDPIRKFEWAIGTVRSVKATPKKHEEFRGVKRTIVNRVAPV